MVAKATPKRDRSGKFLPKWEVALQQVKHEVDRRFAVNADSFTSVKAELADIRSRQGAIGWQIAIDVAMFAAIGYLGLKVYGLVPY